MTKKFTFILGLMMAVICCLPKTRAADTSGFKHPGILHTEEDFDRIRSKVHEGREPWYSGYEKLIANPHAQLTYVAHPTVKLIRGGGSREEPDPDNYANAMNDASAAYQCAIRWKIDGDTRYADKAIQILNAWSNTCIGIYGNSNGALAAGIYGFSFCNAAEIMRSYSGWANKDLEKFKSFLYNIFYSYSSAFMSRRNGTCDGSYWANWGLCNGLNILGVGIFLDDESIYNEGMYYFKYSKDDGREFNEDIQNLVWKLYDNVDAAPLLPGQTQTLGQWQESNRDQGHTSMGVGLAGDVAQIAWNQGEDLYAFKDSRLLAGFEYVAKYNLGNDVPNSTYINCTNNQTTIGSGGRGPMRPIWERIYNHYTKRKGLKTPYSKAYAEKVRPEGGGGDYGTTSGGFDNLGFGTLMYTLDSTFIPSCPDTYLTPSIVVNGTASDKSYAMAKPGNNVTMKAVIPDSVQGGTWLWSTGETTPEITVSDMQKGNVYRVTYTNPCGVKSTQSFCIAVYGDCTPSQIKPYIYYNNTWYGSTSITVKTGDAVTFGCQAGDNRGTMEYWANGKKLVNGLLTVTGPTTVTATYTNTGGAVSTLDMTVDIQEIVPYISINGGANQQMSEAYVSPGANLVLTATASNDVSWSWNTGETVQRLTLNNVQTDGNYTVTLKQGTGRVSSLTYKVFVFQKNSLADGKYYIINRKTGLYLTDLNTISPVFRTSSEDKADPSQLFSVSKDGTRYKITKADNSKRYLNEKCQFGANPYYTNWNSMEIYSSSSGYAALQNGGDAGTKYWTIERDSVINGTGLADPGYPTLFPFQFYPYSTSSITGQTANESIQVFYRYPSLVFTLADETPVQVQVWDAIGRIVASGKVSSDRNELPLGRLPSGVYVIRMNVGGANISRKIVIG